ncbi:cupin domain-containing protein [Rhodoligotrophos defluvii]|uniref:cupin domain-containing protein n=1 Tax=Rhodoligotrophos defluvii TaxID=2561934 RepID=UPI0010C9FEE3|nr:cupin domain-containing protein [Rhodoligotrophos defluvii]
MQLIKLERTGPNAPTPEPGRPAKVIAGDPTTTTWNVVDDRDGELVAGFWEAQPGKWSFTCEAWEFCHIISGEVTITANGQATTLREGDAFVMRPGLECTWEVTRTVLKHYVIVGDA